MLENWGAKAVPHGDQSIPDVDKGESHKLS